ncbi:MAG TPA: energy transducer TonB, partial [Bacteroidia bacterium]|nr:energy transducer TonB [Bacteroidia bacterium]
KEKLRDVRLIRDVIPGYPVNWISTYASVEIQGTCDGKAMKAITPGEELSAEQKYILKHPDLSGDLVINVRYTYKDPVTKDVENNRMHVVMSIVPETEAHFAGGQDEMKKYLRENGVNKIIETTAKQFQKGLVRFTVDEQGDITNTKIIASSGDPKTDQILRELINKMPKWIPAKNAKGAGLKQDFEFSLGSLGC